MIKKIARSIHAMPRAAYIFLLNSIRLCDIMLLFSMYLFISSDGAADSFERIELAWLMFETPAGMLIMTLIGFIMIIDRHQ